MAQPDRSLTSLSLLSGLRSREPEAWNRLVHLYGALIFSWCRRRGLQPADAEDVTQEVFHTVYARIGDFQKDPANGTFRGWLHSITRNKLGDYWRNGAGRPQAVGGSDAHHQLEQLAVEDVEDEEVSAELAAMYRRAFDLIRSEFEEKAWRAFWLVVCENRRSADVAATLNTTLNAVYLAKSRILRRLRETLGDLPVEEADITREKPT